MSSSYSYFGTSAVETLYSLAVLAAMADLFVVVAMIAVLTGIIGACAVKSTSVPTPTLDRPDWIDQGSGAFGGDVGVAFYGV